MFGLQAFRGIVGPTFLALMLVVTMIPIQHWMIRKGWPRWTAITTVVAGAYGILLGLGLILLYAAARFGSLVEQYSSSSSAIEQDVKDALSNLGIGQKQIDDAVSSISPENLAPAIEDVLSSLSGVAGSLFFVLAIIIFLGLDSLGFTDRLRYTAADQTRHLRGAHQLQPGDPHVPLGGHDLRRHRRGRRLHRALAHGHSRRRSCGAFVAFVTNYIPNIGFVIGVIPPAVLGLLVGGWDLMLVVIVVYSIINFVIQSIIQPKFVGDSVNLATTVTFLSMAIWTWTIGPLGALLAVPLTLLTKAILIDLDPSTRWIGTLLGSTTPKDDDVVAGKEPIAPAIVAQPDG